MTPRDVLALGVVIFGTLAGAALLVTAAQGRGIDDSTAYAAVAGALAATAAAIGVAIGWPGQRNKTRDTPPPRVDTDADGPAN